jgi:RNA polymerase sigma-70 factor (ECF subfamily)
MDVGQFYEQYWEDIFRFLRRRMPHADLAEVEDVTMMVFERVLRASPRYRDTGAPPLAWIYRIAANLRTDLARAQATHSSVQIDERIMLPDRDEWEGDSRSVDGFMELVALLAPMQRIAILEHYGLGAPTAETAMLLDVSESEVRKLRARGLKRLRVLLSRQGDDE